MSIVLNGTTGITAPDIDVTAQTTVAAFDAGITLGGSATTLDDYEEGTWTPSFVFDTSTVYTSQSGRYVKIGSTVFVSVGIDVSSRVSDTSSVHVNLPFAVAGSSSFMGCSGSVDPSSSFLALSTNGSAVTANVDASTNVVRIFKADGANLAYSSCAASGTFRMGLVYETNA